MELLNIVKQQPMPITRQIKIKAALAPTYIAFRFPKEFLGKRFKINWGNEVVSLIEDESGSCTVGKTQVRDVAYYRLKFSKKHLPFIPYYAKRQLLDATYDGKTIVFATPIFMPADRKKGNGGGGSKHQDNDFNDLRAAFVLINDLAKKYNCQFKIADDGILTGTIKV